MTSKELLKILLKSGWKEETQRGSHKKLSKKGYNNIIIPMHNKDLSKGLAEAILKQAGLK